MIEESRLAIALHYEKGSGAPVVVAKGKGTIGAKIIEIAKTHDIPIEENEVLAGALSKVELGEEIPPDLYKAVAEVLVFVLRLSAVSADPVIVSPRCGRNCRPPPIRDAALLTRRSALASFTAAALPSRAFAHVAPPRSEIRDSLAKRFADAGTSGTFVGYKVGDYMIIASDKDRSGEAKLPASTFKIPNSLIALETGVVQDPDKDVFPWDGVKRPIEAWNKDHTLRSAIAVSAVPVYQEIARRIGQERMQTYVDLFDYGNRDIGGGIDQFWLTGALRIDPVEQVDFVDRLRRRALQVSRRSQDVVSDILPVTKVGDAVIRAKSGLLGAERGEPSLGWMVGWAEKGSAQTVFALNMDCREPRHIAARMALTQACLSEIGAI
jgi:beta-lactamase class D